jgi:hypothetical protein
MFDEYELYQGVVLRQIFVNSDMMICVRPFTKEGRVNAFVLNMNVGVFIKHSTKRMSPWRFTFHIDQVADLLDLGMACSNSFISFVCGSDGIATLKLSTLYELVTVQDTENAWVRFERSPREMYGVAGNRDESPKKLARGVGSIITALKPVPRT